ncbi:MAG: PAS domain-containing protein [Syntrophobacteraceae bacterium]
MNITKKLITGFLILSVLVAIEGYWGFLKLMDISRPLNKEIPSIINDLSRDAEMDGQARLILYYDEVLTQSVRNFAFTQNPMWEHRYFAFEPLLDTAIQQFIDHGDKEDKNIFKEIAQANIALVSMEHDAIQQVKKGNPSKAISIMESSQYRDQKGIYSRGLDQYFSRRGIQHGHALEASIVTVRIAAKNAHEQLRLALRWTVLFVLIFFFIATAIGIFITRSIAIPIQGLIRVTRLICDGDLSYRVKETHSGEIGVLSRSFNQMTDSLVQTSAQLQKSREDLERRVEERTAELVSTNEQLQRETQERRQIAENLRESEQRWQFALEGNKDGVWDWDLSTDKVYYSPRYVTMLGYESSEVPEHVSFWIDLIHPEDKEAALKANMDCIENRRDIFDVEFRMQAKNGEWLWILGRGKAVVRDSNGRVVRMVGTHTDITERKRAEDEHRQLEERFQRAEKMEALGTLAGGVAHDLNNVLGIVVGYSELLLNDSGRSNSARSKAMEILKGGQRAAAIVQDLLTLARRGVSNRKVLDLNNIVLECQRSPEFAGISSFHPKIRIKTELEAHLLNISGSDVHLSKSLLNLVSNAAEAMPEGGVITIKTGIQYLDKPVSGYDEIREGDYVVLSISDTGEGIPASDLKRVFEPFYTKKVMGRSGTGLGLAVVWGTVKDHHGYINVASEEGKGTSFTLYFPVTREDLSPEKDSVSASEYMGNGESVFVVDDVKEQRDLATAMLEKLNYRVSSIPSGEEAVEYLKQNAVDFVVLDMIMDPGMDGLDTYAKILEINPHQRAIIVSGFSETKRVSKAQKLGAGAYVKKPYVLEKLGLSIRKELDRQA